MAYTKEELRILNPDETVAESRKKIVSINIFDYVDDLKFSDKTLWYIDFVRELYVDYLQLLNEFSKTNKDKILKSLKNIEVIDNHSLEKEKYDLLRVYNETHHSTAINYLLRKIFKENIPLSTTFIKKAHEILMRGTSNEESVGSGYRKNNNYVVGYQEKNVKNIMYFPISYDEIEQAMQLFIDFSNSSLNNQEDLFVRPIMMHGLLSCLQVFEDGNTRLARTVQHVKLFETTNTLLGQNLELPAIYFSKTYIPYRLDYRNLIAHIALSPDNENWNNWIIFNLKRIQDQIYANESVLSRTKKY